LIPCKWHTQRAKAVAQTGRLIPLLDSLTYAHGVLFFDGSWQGPSYLGRANRPLLSNHQTPPDRSCCGSHRRVFGYRSLQVHRLQGYALSHSWLGARRFSHASSNCQMPCDVDARGHSRSRSSGDLCSCSACLLHAQADARSWHARQGVQCPQLLQSRLLPCRHRDPVAASSAGGHGAGCRFRSPAAAAKACNNLHLSYPLHTFRSRPTAVLLRLIIHNDRSHGYDMRRSSFNSEAESL